MSVQQALSLGIATLQQAGIDSAARDARALMASALGVAPERVTLHLRDPLEDAREAAFFADIAQRAARKPVSHLVGGRQFYGRWFEVSGDVLDPRPETETLIAAALALTFTEVLDLGTGSGCILLTLLSERARATGVGGDISQAALRVAQRNAQALGVAARCTMVQSPWYDAIDRRFDLIVSNPPYIRADEMAALAPELGYEPRIALTDEGDGLSAYRRIIAGAGAHLCPGGALLLEIGPEQGGDVAAMVNAAGFAGVRILPDLDGRDRVVEGHWPL